MAIPGYLISTSPCMDSISSPDCKDKQKQQVYDNNNRTKNTEQLQYCNIWSCSSTTITHHLISSFLHSQLSWITVNNSSIILSVPLDYFESFGIFSWLCFGLPWTKYAQFLFSPFSFFLFGHIELHLSFYHFAYRPSSVLSKLRSQTVFQLRRNLMK